MHHRTDTNLLRLLRRGVPVADPTQYAEVLVKRMQAAGAQAIWLTLAGTALANVSRLKIPAYYRRHPQRFAG